MGKKKELAKNRNFDFWQGMHSEHQIIATSVVRRVAGHG